MYLIDNRFSINSGGFQSAINSYAVVPLDKKWLGQFKYVGVCGIINNVSRVGPFETVNYELLYILIYYVCIFIPDSC